jgi:hypothetical protein
VAKTIRNVFEKERKGVRRGEHRLTNEIMTLNIVKNLSSTAKMQPISPTSPMLLHPPNNVPAPGKSNSDKQLQNKSRKNLSK